MVEVDIADYVTEDLIELQTNIPKGWTILPSKPKEAY